MGPLRAVILDDERAARSYLAELLGDVGGVEVVGSFAEPEAALAVAESGAALDVLFADVDLSGGGADASGLEWARQIAAAKSAPCVVLATAHPQHALEGFDLGAVDFLVKPWRRDRVARCLERVRERVRPRPAGPTRLAARRGRDIRLVPLDEILAFEAADRLSFVHTAAGRFDVDLTLSSLQSSFGARFVRAHRQWLVALAHVLEVQTLETGLRLQVGQHLTVPVSTERSRDVRAAVLAGTVGLRR
jgi:two-component system, LytTR family, response regulator LytT